MNLAQAHLTLALAAFTTPHQNLVCHPNSKIIQTPSAAEISNIPQSTGNTTTPFMNPFYLWYISNQQVGPTTFPSHKQHYAYYIMEN